MKTVVITGISGTLGKALGKYYINAGWRVIGVTRKESLEGDWFTEICTNQQQTVEDAQQLLAYDPHIIYLNAGQIESEIGENGEPLVEYLNSITSINYLFPATVSIESSKQKLDHTLDVVHIGSIADGSPSCFGPLYHASKISLHHFVTGSGAIINSRNPNVRIKLYRPGAIKGPLAWAPVNRLNKKGYEVRAQRVNSAPDADTVAKKIADFVESGQWIGTYDEPISFKFLKFLFALAPNAYYKLQMLAWKKTSKFTTGG